MTAQTRDLAHDGRASLVPKHLSNLPGSRLDGWYVVRRCPCHFGETISVPFDSQGKAEHLVDVLDDDARKYATLRR